eukprot:Hpha_TRINITY_DN15833_c2_g9::TRINITY_DN15833_c2_g9_i1::g.187354::m.187354
MPMDMGLVAAAGGATSLLAGISFLPIEPVTGLTLAASGLSAMVSSNRLPGAKQVAAKALGEREEYTRELNMIRERTAAMEREVEHHRERVKQVQSALLWSAVTCSASVAYMLWSRRGRRTHQHVAAAAAGPAVPFDPQGVVAGIVVHHDGEHPIAHIVPVRPGVLELQDYNRSDGEFLEALESRERAEVEREQQFELEELLCMLHGGDNAESNNTVFFRVGAQVRFVGGGRLRDSQVWSDGDSLELGEVGTIRDIAEGNFPFVVHFPRVTIRLSATDLAPLEQAQ